MKHHSSTDRSVWSSLAIYGNWHLSVIADGSGN